MSRGAWLTAVGRDGGARWRQTVKALRHASGALTVKDSSADAAPWASGGGTMQHKRRSEQTSAKHHGMREKPTGIHGRRIEL